MYARILLIAVLLGGLLLPGVGFALEVRDYVNKAIALIEAEDYDLARTYLEPALISPLISSGERSRAYYLRGFSYLAEDMPVSARKDFYRALEFSSTNKGALVELGLLHAEGKGTVQDEVLAISLFEQAADMGYDRGQFHLGHAYLYGRGVDKNISKAREWLQRAADADHVLAMLNLAASYRAQLVADPQPDIALAWYERAHAKGAAPALLSIGFMYANGEIDEPDHSAAVAYFQRALDEGMVSASTHVAYAYLVGRGVKEDHERALALYNQGAENEVPAAYVGLGHMYHNGLGVKADTAAAKRWYEKAAELNDAEALNRLIALHLSLDDDEERSAALRWSKVAADSGRPQAVNDYAWLLATSPVDTLRNGTLALDQAKKAVAAEPTATYLDTLAAAYAELGNFEQAIATQQEALASITADQLALKDEFERRLKNYERSEPWRE